MKLIRIISSLLIIPTFALVAQAQAPNIQGRAGRVLNEKAKNFLVGYACVVGNPAPINIEVYLNGPEGKGQKMGTTFVTDQPHETGISQLCKTAPNVKHRYKINVDAALKTNKGQAIYVYGVSGKTKKLLDNSGQIKIP